jgi:hypothetical protein
MHQESVAGDFAENVQPRAMTVSLLPERPMSELSDCGRPTSLQPQAAVRSTMPLRHQAADALSIEQ